MNATTNYERIKNRLRTMIIGASLVVSLAVSSVALFGQAPVYADTTQFILSAASGDTYRLAYTFDSPNEPWTAAEVTQMKAWLEKDYAAMVDVYGEPSGSYNINVVKDSNLYAGGEHSSGRITLRSLAEDVLIHESLHAFRGFYVMSNRNVWEEGQTRAAEIEVANLVGLDYVQSHHKFTFDMFYENNNIPRIGITNGNMYSGSSLLTFARYQQSGYAWGKVLIENPTFLAKFNKKLYLFGPAASQSTMINAAAAIQPTVEGEPFADWFAKQQIFNNSQSGCVPRQRIPQMTIDFLCVYEDGREVPQSNRTIEWAVYGSDGRLFSNGGDVTNDSGFVPSINPTAPDGYTGLAQIDVWAVDDSGIKQGSSAIVKWDAINGYEHLGVFGTVNGAQDGTVTFESLDNAFSPFSVPVQDGAFSALNLETVRGTIKATYTGSLGTYTKTFTKDASSYSIMLGEPLQQSTTPRVKFDNISGSNQTTPSGEPFLYPLRLHTSDMNGNTTLDVPVKFTIKSDNDVPGYFTNGETEITATPDGEGYVEVYVQENDMSANYTVTASAPGAFDVVTYNLVNKYHYSFVNRTGTPQVAYVNNDFGQRLSTKVVDELGNPIPNVDVTFRPAATSTQGVLFNGAAQATVKTDSDGIATSPVIKAGATAGAYGIEAASPGIKAVKFVLSVENLSLGIDSGHNQSALIKTPFSTQIRVWAKNSSGAVVPNVPITFTVPTTGASGKFNGTSSTVTVNTNASGFAIAPSFTANDVVGQFKMNYKSAYSTATGDITLTNTQYTMGSATGSGQSATINTNFASQLKVKVTNASGVAQANVPVTFTAPTSGASGKFGSVTTVTVNTDSSGFATAPVFKANGTKGTHTVKATTNSSLTTVNYTLTNK